MPEPIFEPRSCWPWILSSNHYCTSPLPELLWRGRWHACEEDRGVETALLGPTLLLGAEEDDVGDCAHWVQVLQSSEGQSPHVSLSSARKYSSWNRLWSWGIAWFGFRERQWDWRPPRKDYKWITYKKNNTCAFLFFLHHSWHSTVDVEDTEV